MTLEVIDQRSLARLLGFSDEAVRQACRSDDPVKIDPQFDIYIGPRIVRVVSLVAALDYWGGVENLHPRQAKYLSDLRVGTITIPLSYSEGHEGPEGIRLAIVNSGGFPARGVHGGEFWRA